MYVGVCANFSSPLPATTVEVQVELYCNTRNEEEPEEKAIRTVKSFADWEMIS